MSHVIDRRPIAGDAGPQPQGTSRTRRLVMAIIALGLLVGAVVGWSAFTMLSPTVPGERSLDAQRARWEAAAEDAAERAAPETRRLDIERQRWEAKADHFAPGWRER
jgi:hypothetical protein